MEDTTHRPSDIKLMMQDHYLQYASYVILDRAIPNVIDGLKPVQRRILHTLWEMDDGKLHKVANVAGQTMAFHPHGDAAITDALIHLSNKNYLLDQQGNFGNLLTGDSAAAARYIETRLSPLARETMFNPQLTETVPSYDGRKQEPICLPAKIPVLLMHGAEGIAVGMATSILPHNFIELLEAEIAILEEKPFELMPDFPTGGLMDASGYAKGKGKVKLRVKIEIKDSKTLVIHEICYGTTTETLIRSIDEAAKRGKIKIEGIHDYTSDKVEIEIKLPRGQYAEEMVTALYAYTECEVTLNPQMIVIKDNLPWEPTVDEVLALHVEKLQEYLRKELEFEGARLAQKIFEKTLEQIFIENRLYKKIENVTTYEMVHQNIEESLEPFHNQLSRIPTYEDRERLLSIPIRRISRFDIEQNQKDITVTQTTLAQVEKDLKQIKKYTIGYLKKLIAKYGDAYPRRTRFSEIEQVDLRAIAKKTVKIGVDLEGGFVGTKVSGDQVVECTNFDKLLLFFSDGTYSVHPIPEKLYVAREGKKLIFAGVADKQTVFSVVYKDLSKYICLGKRFIVQKFIMEKVYRFFEEGMELQLFTSDPKPNVELYFVPKANQKSKKVEYPLGQVLIKGVTARGIRLSPKAVRKVVLCSSP